MLHRVEGHPLRLRVLLPARVDLLQRTLQPLLKFLHPDLGLGRKQLVVLVELFCPAINLRLIVEERGLCRFGDFTRRPVVLLDAQAEALEGVVPSEQCAVGVPRGPALEDLDKHEERVSGH